MNNRRNNTAAALTAAAMLLAGRGAFATLSEPALVDSDLRSAHWTTVFTNALQRMRKRLPGDRKRKSIFRKGSAEISVREKRDVPMSRYDSYACSRFRAGAFTSMTMVAFSGL